MLLSLMLLGCSHNGTEKICSMWSTEFTSALQLAKHSHSFFPLNLRAAQQLSREIKSQGLKAQAQGPPPCPGCHRESAVMDLGPLIPISLLFPPGLPHFELSMFSLPRGPEKRLSPFIFQRDIGCFYFLSISSFRGEISFLYFCWS